LFENYSKIINYNLLIKMVIRKFSNLNGLKTYVTILIHILNL